MANLQLSDSSLVRKWLSAQPEAFSFIFPAPLTEARCSEPSKGLGLFIRTPVAAFTPLLIEDPMILMKPTDDLPDLYLYFTALSPVQKECFLRLSYQHNISRDAELTAKLQRRALNAGVAYSDDIALMVRVADIMQTNAFNVDLQDGQGARHRATFPHIARINHSCAPNAHVCFYPPQPSHPQGQMIVRALRSLSAGEEVLISYFNILLPLADRQSRTKKWGFTCYCPVCDESLHHQAVAEERRVAINDFLSTQAQEIRNSRSSADGVKRMITAGERIVAYAEHIYSLYPALPDVYDALGLLQAKTCLQQSCRINRGSIVTYLEQAAIWESRITGLESPASKRRLTKVKEFAQNKGTDLDPRIKVDTDGNHVIIWAPVGQT